MKLSQLRMIAMISAGIRFAEAKDAKGKKIMTFKAHKHTYSRSCYIPKRCSKHQEKSRRVIQMFKGTL
jgi:hypothetical protein